MVIVLVFQTCKDPFEAKSSFKNTNFLVVEGFINVGQGVTQIKLSRVTPLNQVSERIPENGATIFIEDDQGSEYALHPGNNGVYESDVLDLDVVSDYRLRIELGGKVYFSDYTTPAITPPIDSVNWKLDNDNFITIYANTHDPNNGTLYYKWEYEEVWEVRSTYRTDWAWESGAPRIRTAEESRSMYYCWKYNYNKDFLIATSAKLSSDIISLFPLNKFYITDPRLGWRYSILVKQRALTVEEFEYLQLMKKNTSDLGSFFDSQPSQQTGNIRCTTSDEPVIGYIGSYTSQNKRFFLDRDVISDFPYTSPCGDPVGNLSLTDPNFSTFLRYWIPIEPIYVTNEGDDAPILVGLKIGRDYCTDCRINAGTAPKPDFWVAEDEEDEEVE
jgi:Domain of unknown function (DUF4249)